MTAHLHDLVRSDGEPRWTTVVDALLAVGVVAWALTLALTAPGEALRIAVPLVLAVAVVVRVVVLAEHVQRWRDRGLGETAPQTGATQPVAGSAESSRAA